MRKEIFIAIIVGVGVGAAIAFGIWRANSALKNNLPELPTLLQRGSPTEAPSQFKITISQPEQNDVISESPVVIAGITKPSSTLVISGETEDKIVTTDSQGAFSQEISLSSGINQIIVAAYGGGERTKNSLTIVYSSEFAKEIKTPPTSPTQTEENEIREKVQEKLEEAKRNLKAYFGTVTDKTQDSLQVKNPNDEIQLVSVNPEHVSFAKVTKTLTSIKYDDIAIGDFVVAMGVQNGNGVLTAVRILVTDPIKEPTRSILLGTITKIGRNEVNLLSKDGSEITLVFPKRWKGPDLDDLEEEQKLIAIGVLNGKILNVRTIEVVEEEISPTP